MALAFEGINTSGDVIKIKDAQEARTDRVQMYKGC